MIFPAEFDSRFPLSGLMGPIYHIRGKNKRRREKVQRSKQMSENKV